MSTPIGTIAAAIFVAIGVCVLLGWLFVHFVLERDGLGTGLDNVDDERWRR